MNELISKEIEFLSNATEPHIKIQHITTIIQLCDESNQQTKYKYIRQYIYEHISNSESLLPNYLQFDVEKLFMFITEIQDLRTQLSLLKYCKKQCNVHSINEYHNKINAKIKHINLNLAFKQFKFKDLPTLILKIIDLNAITLSISLIFIFLLHCLFLYPHNGFSNNFFNIKYDNFNINPIINHISNVTFSAFGGDTAFKVTPLNTCGVILYALERFFIFILGIAYLVKKIKSEYDSE